MNEKFSRTIIKAILWRVIALIATFLIIFLVTGSIEISITIGAVDLIIKTALYIMHERLWSKIKWGFKKNL